MQLLRSSLLTLAALAATTVFTCGAVSAADGLGEPGPRHVSPRSVVETQGRVIVQYRQSASILSAGAASSSTSTTTTAATQQKIAAANTNATAIASTGGPQLASTLSARLGLPLLDGRALSARSQVLHAKGLSSAQLAQTLSAQPDVEWAVVDGRRFATAAPNDPLYGDSLSSGLVTGQWYLRAPTNRDSQGNKVVSSIDVESAWAVTEGNSSLVVAVLDTGVRSNHPDLAGKLLPGYDFISDTAVANDGGGRDADPSDPGDWITAAEDASGTFKDCGAGDSTWHGTQTISLVGATAHNGIGMAGVAPAVKLLPVRVLGKCGGYDSDIIAGMRWAAGLSVSGVTTNANPAKVLNLSLGSSGSCSAAYQSALAELTAAKVVVVAAAGNEGLAVGVPANCPGVIGVAGLRHSGTKVGYSNLGPEVVVAAPAGNCVLTTTCLYPIVTALDTGTTSPVSSSYSDGSNYSVGTSFSSPIVAGAVALMLSANANLTPGEVATLLKSTARAFPSTGADPGVAACQAPSGAAQAAECYCTTTTCGGGMLDAGAAVKAALAAAQASAAPTAVISASAATLSKGASVTLNGSSSTAAASRSIASYAWTLTSGTGVVSLSGSTGSSVVVTGLASGSATVSLVVTDSTGIKSTAASQTLQVNTPPVVSITASNPAPMSGSNVTLTGTAVGQGGASIVSYSWAITTGTTLASFSGATNAATATLQAIAAGAVTVTLTATDSSGLSSTATQSVTISSPPDTSSGGGAIAPWWALGLLLIGAGVRPRRRSR